MSADTKTSKLYDAAIDEVTGNGRAWKSICRLTGQLYRYEFDNILMVYMQRPGAKLIAGYLSYFSDKYPYPCFIVILL